MKDKDALVPEEFTFRLVTPDDAAPAWHQQLELVFVLQGTGLFYQGQNESSYVIRAGDIFVVNSYQMRSIVLDSGALALSLLLSPAFLATMSPEVANVNINCKSFLFAENRQQAVDLLRRDFALAFRTWYKNESALPLHLRGKLVVLLDDMVQNFQEIEKPRQTTGRERLWMAVDYIQRHYRENITLDTLAKQTYLSAAYLSRVFQKDLGTTFTAYLAKVRLMHAVGLLRGDTTITDIAYSTGFPSASALIAAFKQHHGVTPGQFRREMAARRAAAPPQNMESEEGFSMAFASLMKYAAQADDVKTARPAAVNEVSANAAAPLRPLRHNWRRLVNAGYARDLLNGSIQGQIAKLQRKVGFEYIRCKGVLDDDMMVYTANLLGEPAYNFVYIDEVVDFILSIGAQPLLELSHMPSLLAKNRAAPSGRPTVISAPTDIARWEALITTLMTHFMQRYGVEAVKKWIFPPWTSLDFAGMGAFTLEEYTAIYATAYRAIKQVCGELRVCSTGSTTNALENTRWFLDMCREEGCVPDILGFRSFACVEPDTEKGALYLPQSSEAFRLAVSGDEDFLAHTLRDLRGLLKERALSHLPVLLDEWSNNVWQRDLCNDTSYKSAYLFKAILENYDSFYAMGYFNITDQLDEIAPSADVFHGGFGLFTRNGLPKSAFRAMQLLARTGSELLAAEKSCFITRSKDEVQVFLYNYAHYDRLYRYRHTTNLTKTERYKVFNAKNPQSYHIKIDGLAQGSHRVRRYSIGPAGGSTFDAWLAMGAPAPMDAEEEKLLRSLSRPAYHTETVQSDGTVALTAYLQPHEVQLITLSR